MADRPRRANAGSRMTKLIEEAQDEEEGDDFYKNTYGGFNEDEEDQDYVSEDEQEDIVDSGRNYFLGFFFVQFILQLTLLNSNGFSDPSRASWSIFPLFISNDLVRP